MTGLPARLATIASDIVHSAERIGAAVVKTAETVVADADLVIDDAAPLVTMLGPQWQAEYLTLRAGADKLNAELQAIELGAAAAGIELPHPPAPGQSGT